MKIYYVLYEVEGKYGGSETSVRLFREQAEANAFAAHKLVEREEETYSSTDEDDLKEAKEALAREDYEAVIDLIYNEDIEISYQEI